MIYLEERDCGSVNMVYNDGRSKQIPYKPQRGYYHELLNFYRAAKGEEPLSVTPELEYGDAMTVFAILDSIRGNAVIPVDIEQNLDYGQKPPITAKSQPVFRIL